jgi:hypothetical protein
MQKPVLEHSTAEGNRKGKSSRRLTPVQSFAMSLESAEVFVNRQNPSPSSADFTFQSMGIPEVVWVDPKHRDMRVQVSRHAAGCPKSLAVHSVFIRQ